MVEQRTEDVKEEQDQDDDDLEVEKDDEKRESVDPERVLTPRMGSDSLPTPVTAPSTHPTRVYLRQHHMMATWDLRTVLRFNFAFSMLAAVGMLSSVVAWPSSPLRERLVVLVLFAFALFFYAGDFLRAYDQLRTLRTMETLISEG